MQRNTKMLSVYAEAFWKNGNPEGQQQAPPPPDEAASGQSSHIYQLSTFYSVSFSESGEVLSVDNEDTNGLTDEYLIGLCRRLIELNNGKGLQDSWIYLVENRQDGNLESSQSDSQQEGAQATAQAGTQVTAQAAAQAGTQATAQAGTQAQTLVVLMNNEVMSDNMYTLFRNTLLFGGAAILLLILPSFYLAHRIVHPLEEIHQKQKQFVSDASHELKTPIAVISTNAEMLERELGESKWLNNIKYENRQMGELVRQLLELARLEHAAPEMTRLDFSRIVTGSVLPFECVAFEKEITLQTSIPEGIHVYGNAEQLGNLVSNLLDNALEYSPAQKPILVSLKSEHHMAVLTVSNEGESIPESQRKSLFERFYRADVSRTGNSGHYGLGLAIVKAIVTAHNGKISVSCKQNQVIFTVSLPIVS
ncbi:MAG: HAMP domain-containing histidine kinase [Clostridiales bacterium]|nr:HAMP domain-containing histidine kinase [Clostridiales bacterium]